MYHKMHIIIIVLLEYLIKRHINPLNCHKLNKAIAEAFLINLLLVMDALEGLCMINNSDDGNEIHLQINIMNCKILTHDYTTK